MKTPVYLDYAATTPADPAVVAAMTRYLGPDGAFGNAASRLHSFGREAEEAVEQARVQVAELINADPREIVWTSGATESNNLAIKGVAAQAGRGAHVVTSAIEHKAVLDPCLRLERSGFEITRIEPGNDGLISPDRVLSALRDDTILLSLMHVNNEIGAVTDVETIGRTARDRGVPFHVDAAQSAARLPLDVERQHADFVSLSGHKMYGPKGVGPWIVAYFGGKDFDAPPAARLGGRGGGRDRAPPADLRRLQRHPGRIAARHRPPAAEPRRHPRRRSADRRENHRAVHRPDVLGQRDRPGYIPPTRNFRWCTDRMKILPTNRLIERLILTHGRAVLLIGTRRSESQHRGHAMDRRGVTATEMNPHGAIEPRQRAAGDRRAGRTAGAGADSRRPRLLGAEGARRPGCSPGASLAGTT